MNSLCEIETSREWAYHGVGIHRAELTILVPRTVPFVLRKDDPLFGFPDPFIPFRKTLAVSTMFSISYTWYFTPNDTCTNVAYGKPQVLHIIPSAFFVMTAHVLSLVLQGDDDLYATVASQMGA